VRTFRLVTLISILLCFCVVVFGAYVRLADAGLGCPDWPGCYGHLDVPRTDAEIAHAEARYPERPVEAPKAWKEMIHRYLASTLGLLIVALALMSLRLRQAGAPRGLSWFLVGLVIFQGILGMWTVTWQLKPLVVTAHLIGGMTTLSLLVLLGLRVFRPRPVSDTPDAPVTDAGTPLVSAPSGLRRWAAIGLVVVALQIFLGGWTSTNYAALACPDFPTCHGRWLPETDFPTAFTLWHGLGINYEFGILDNRARVTIHWVHRVGAIVVTAVIGLLGLMLLLRAQAPLYRGLGALVLGLLAVQVAIGIMTVKLQLPLLLAAAHNGGAALLLLSLVSLNYYAWKPLQP
jgi:cytochrome c oxidase assembly protein subunit 15